MGKREQNSGYEKVQLNMKDFQGEFLSSERQGIRWQKYRQPLGPGWKTGQHRYVAPWP